MRMYRLGETEVWPHRQDGGTAWRYPRKKAHVKCQENEKALPSIPAAGELHPQEEKSIYFQSRDTQEIFLIIPRVTSAEIDMIKLMVLEWEEVTEGRV